VNAFGGLLLHGDAWRHQTFDGTSVAVVAPGREAAAIVPEVVRTARAVKVFQEEPDWLLPEPRLLSLPSSLRRAAARLNLRRTVDDRWLRRRLTPNSRFNKRPPEVDDRYYAALQQPTCTLITWPVYAVVERGLRSAEGIEHHVDCIIVGASSAWADEINHEESCA